MSPRAGMRRWGNRALAITAALGGEERGYVFMNKLQLAELMRPLRSHLDEPIRSRGACSDWHF